MKNNYNELARKLYHDTQISINGYEFICFNDCDGSLIIECSHNDNFVCEDVAYSMEDIENIIIEILESELHDTVYAINEHVDIINQDVAMCIFNQLVEKSKTLQNYINAINKHYGQNTLEIDDIKNILDNLNINNIFHGKSNDLQFMNILKGCDLNINNNIYNTIALNDIDILEECKTMLNQILGNQAY